MRKLVTTVSIALVIAASVRPANAGINFNFTWGPNIPAGMLSDVQTATTYAANQIKNLYKDNLTLNLTVDGMNTGLGMSSAPLMGTYSLLQVKTALTYDRTSTDDNTAVANLPIADPTGGSNFQMARGLAKALGLLTGTDAGTDGTFSFGISNAYTFDSNNRAASGKYDFIGVAEHELTELMGRVVRVNSSGNGWRPLDLYRFTSSGRSTSATDTNVSFSIDGTTLLKKFNANGNGGDLGDWASGQGNDAFNAFGGTNEQDDISATDIRLMDVIGWDLASVPEPSTLSLLALGGVLWKVSKRKQLRK